MSDEAPGFRERQHTFGRRADDYAVKNIARETAKECIKEFCELLGIADIQETRRHLDHLAELVEKQADNRAEKRRTLYGFLGAVAAALFGYAMAWVNTHH